MVFGTVRMNPHLGGALVSLDASEAEKMPGVIKVVPIKTHLGNGFGVIAKTTWHAFQAADAVKVEWGAAPYPADSAGMWQVLADAAAGSGSVMRNDGNVENEFADAPRERLIEAEYKVPFLAHAAMEPMNATARLKDGVLDIWAPNQAPIAACAPSAPARPASTRRSATSMSPISAAASDGGWKRTTRSMPPSSRKSPSGLPVKVTWTREEDITHDTYRPAALGRFRARLDEAGMPVAVDLKVVSPSIMASVLPRFYPMLAALGPDKTLTDGALQPALHDPELSGLRREGRACRAGRLLALGRQFHQRLLPRSLHGRDRDGRGHRSGRTAQAADGRLSHRREGGGEGRRNVELGRDAAQAARRRASPSR